MRRRAAARSIAGAPRVDPVDKPHLLATFDDLGIVPTPKADEAISCTSLTISP